MEDIFKLEKIRTGKEAVFFYFVYLITGVVSVAIIAFFVGLVLGEGGSFDAGLRLGQFLAALTGLIGGLIPLAYLTTQGASESKPNENPPVPPPDNLAETHSENQ